MKYLNAVSFKVIVPEDIHRLVLDGMFPTEHREQ
jgi:hypothetical protein